MAGVISSAILRTQTDERLVALARAGHKRAFEAIAERYRAELTRSLRRILPSSGVEDALQQTHLQAWQALAAGTEVRELRAWLHRIARNAAIAAASRGYDYEELKDALLVSPGPDEDLERRDAVRRALRGIAELPERQRDALLAVAVEGRSHAALALDLGITDTAARQLVRRARVSLIGMMSVAMPPPLVIWAARAGHTVVAGKAAAGKAAAGKAAASKAAAGTGLGGSFGGAALKVGVIAVTVGGVAAGVPQVRHALVPSAPAPVVHHHARGDAGQPSYVTAAVTTPVAHTASAGRQAIARAARAARRRRALHDANPLLVAPAPAVTQAAAGAPSAAAVPSPAANAAAPATVAAAAPAGLSAAALWAWLVAQEARQHPHGSQAASQTTTSSSGTGGQEQGTASGRWPGNQGPSTGCGTTGPSGPSGPTGPTGPTGVSVPAGSTSGSTSGSTTGTSGKSDARGGTATTFPTRPSSDSGRGAGGGSAGCGSTGFNTTSG